MGKNAYLCRVKKVATYILTSLVALTYSLCMVGVGVYDCHCSHNQQIVWLAGDDCTCNHEHEHAHEQEKRDGCCDVSYKILQVDQDLTANNISFVHASLIDFVFIPVNIFTAPDPILVAEYSHSPPPLKFHSQPDIYTLSQLRL